MSAPETRTQLGNPVIAVYDTHDEAESAIKTLSRAGFDMKKLSIIGKGYRTEEHAMGFYTAGDRIRTWGRVGGFWGAIWGLLAAPAVFVIPPVGLLAIGGPFVLTLIAALEGAVLLGGLSALGGALVSLGTSRDEAVKYEADVKADRFLIMVHGSADDIRRARDVLAGSTLPGVAA